MPEAVLRMGVVEPGFPRFRRGHGAEDQNARRRVENRFQRMDDEHMEGLCGPYLRVVVPGTAELANTIAKVKITGIKEDFLLGELN
jgi:hypothetical protein